MDQRSLFECLIKVDKPLEALPAVQLSEAQTVCIKQGQAITFQSLETSPGKVRMYHDAAFLGLGEMLLDGKLAPKKLFNLP
jgi:tRNA pseudouridine55 synthase